jgi:hypothetical protein
MPTPRTGIGALLAIVCSLAVIVFELLPATARATSWWVPPQRLTWYWQLTGTVKVEPVQATDMDGFDNTAGTVAYFHSVGQRAICYIDVGTWENWRSDAGEFPSSVLGNDNGWPGERWLDIRQLSVLEPIMTARFQMCQQKGFDAVEPDNMDGYENDTGFAITAAQQLAYDTWVAQEVHSLGMAVFQKNDPDQAGQLESYFDGVIDEQCNQYSECSSYQAYLNAGKPVLDAEYEASLYPSFCTADQAAGIMGALYALALDGSVYEPCFGPIPPGPPVAASAPGAVSGPPRVRIRSGSATVKRGEVAIRLSCPNAQSSCIGTLELDAVTPGRHARSRRPRSTLLLGSTRFQVSVGSSKLLVVKLRRKALTQLAASRSVSALATATTTDASGQAAKAQRVVKLNLRPRARRPASHTARAGGRS